MEQSYFTIIYYYGRYIVCQTHYYEIDLMADDEDKAREKFKEEKPDARIKQLYNWGTKSGYLKSLEN